MSEADVEMSPSAEKEEEEVETSKEPQNDAVTTLKEQNLTSEDGQTSTTPLAKKRKLNATATNTLLKPFKSPLKDQSDAEHDSAGTTTTTTSLHPRSIAEITSSTSHLKSPFHVPLQSTHPKQQQTTQDYSTLPLHRANSRLESIIKATRTEIDELQTATRLLHGTRDAELEALIVKWRGASRAACEEMFAGVRDKVNRMGGVGAWREKERAIVDRRAAWAEEDRRACLEEEKGVDDDDDDDGDDDDVDAEDGGGGGGEMEGKAERKMKREERRQARKEMREAQAYEVSEYDRAAEEEAKTKDAGLDVGQDDDAFTMDMMLKALGIELDKVGWDVEAQRWTEE